MNCLCDNQSTEIFSGSFGSIICVCIVLLQISIHLVSLTNNEWIEGDEMTEGLWNSCSFVGNITCCERINDVPIFLEVTQACAITSTVILGVLLAIRWWQMETDGRVKIPWLLIAFSNLFLIVASVLYVFYGLSESTIGAVRFSKGFYLYASTFPLSLVDLIISCAYKLHNKRNAVTPI